LKFTLDAVRASRGVIRIIFVAIKQQTTEIQRKCFGSYLLSAVMAAVQDTLALLP